MNINKQAEHQPLENMLNNELLYFSLFKLEIEHRKLTTESAATIKIIKKFIGLSLHDSS